MHADSLHPSDPAADDTVATTLDEATAQAALHRYTQWLARVSAEPWHHDFYQTLRRFEAAHPQLPRMGEAARPVDEPLRVAQPAELSFAPASLHGLVLRADGPPRLLQRMFGLLGPNGPLPTHLTELTRERANHHADHALQRFLDLLTHRFALLFYRAWAQAQPVTSLDRAGDQQFARRLGALAGLGVDTVLGRDAAGDAAKLHFTGRLARQTRDAEGLLAWCRLQFDAPVRIAQWCGHWMPLARDERSRLRGADRQALGQGAVLGASVWDVQHKFRIVIGPLRLAAYNAFLPGGPDLARLQAMVRQWVGLEFEWDLQLLLASADVPRARLGGSGQLGRTAWVNRRHHASASPAARHNTDADDLVLDVERTLRHRKPRHAAQPA